MTLRIFLSHSHEDNDWCNGFVAELKQYGVDIWYDQEGLFVGAQWVETIQKELTEREYFLIIITPASMASRWVKIEVASALHLGKTIIPILLQHTQVPPFLAIHQVLDVQGQESVDAASVVASRLGLKIRQQPIPPTPKPLLRQSYGAEQIHERRYHATYGVKWYSQIQPTDQTGTIETISVIRDSREITLYAIYERILQRGDRISPSIIKRWFSPLTDNQSQLDFVFLLGDDNNPNNNAVIGTVALSLPPNTPHSQAILCCFEIHDDGSFRCYLIDPHG